MALTRAIGNKTVANLNPITQIDMDVSIVLKSIQTLVSLMEREKQRVIHDRNMDMNWDDLDYHHS